MLDVIITGCTSRRPALTSDQVKKSPPSHHSLLQTSKTHRKNITVEIQWHCFRYQRMACCFMTYNSILLWYNVNIQSYLNYPNLLCTFRWTIIMKVVKQKPHDESEGHCKLSVHKIKPVFVYRYSVYTADMLYALHDQNTCKAKTIH